MNIEQIRANAPKGATGYYAYDDVLRYIRKTPKNYFYQNKSGARWWKVPTTALRFIKDNYKPL